jgi:hypothetical protein
VREIFVRAHAHNTAALHLFSAHRSRPLQLPPLASPHGHHTTLAPRAGAPQRIVHAALGHIAREAKEDLWKMFRRNVALRLRVRVDRTGRKADAATPLDTSPWL